ncbi:30S ribosomal protein S15 [Candidatus Gottesmanbacteria bacterium RBG_16_37_8]|uniref:Small ribosomal subunit protein uS15 n=1 Tax=Candidatus Gottesmanbacteria bacterium RBG_16_37_8 TaxID=1798371 RepID=A0A1F5YRY9_9BACT|nr:MAG: 30S ribosomal protein S15 [Candidatus Gottesmanbacteria bacterium RBG_16_37_8]
MALDPNNKIKIINEYATKKGDTGSPEVQIALLSHKIDKLVNHLKGNPKDNHSRRGLLGMISKRRRLITYLSGKDELRYKDIIKKLNLPK